MTTSREDLMQMLPAVIDGSDLAEMKSLIQKINKDGRSLFEAIKIGDAKQVSKLLELGVKPNVLNENCKGPVQYAASLKQWAIVNVFLKHKSITHNSNDFGCAFLIVVSNNKIDIIKEFVKTNAPKNLYCVETRRNALHYAVLTKSLEAIKLLLTTDVNLFQGDYNGNTPTDLALREGFFEAVCVLNEHVKPNYKEEKTNPIMNSVKSWINSDPARANLSLINAIKEDKLDWAKLILEAGVKLTAEHVIDDYCLHIAAIKQNSEMIKLLLAADAKINSENDKKQTPIDIAIDNLDAEILTLFKDHEKTNGPKDSKNSEIEKPDSIPAINDSLVVKSLNKALINAIETDQINRVEFILKNGANLKEISIDGNPILHWAIKRKSNVDSVRLLLQYTTDMTVLSKAGKGNKGYPAVRLAARMSASHPNYNKILKEFLNHGQFSQNPQLFGFALLDILANQDYTPANVDIIKDFIDKGVPVNQCFRETGENALHLAIKHRDITTIRFLVEAGVKLNHCDNMGVTPVQLAQSVNYLAASSLFSEYNDSLAKKSVVLESKTTLKPKLQLPDQMLRNAVDVCNVKLAESALQAGADPNLQYIEGNSLLNWAVKFEHADRLKMVALLLEHKADHLKLNSENTFPFYHAAKNKQWDCVRIFLQFKYTDTAFEYLLLFAVDQDDVELVNELLSYKIPVTVQAPNSKWNALHFAVTNKNIKIIEVLMNAGVDPLCPNAKGKTPEDFALKQGDIEIIEMFLKHRVKMSKEKTSDKKAEAVSTKKLEHVNNKNEEKSALSPKSTTPKIFISEIQRAMIIKDYKKVSKLFYENADSSAEKKKEEDLIRGFAIIGKKNFAELKAALSPKTHEGLKLLNYINAGCPDDMGIHAIFCQVYQDIVNNRYTDKGLQLMASCEHFRMGILDYIKDDLSLEAQEKTFKEAQLKGPLYTILGTSRSRLPKFLKKPSNKYFKKAREYEKKASEQLLSAPKKLSLIAESSTEIQPKPSAPVMEEVEWEKNKGTLFIADVNFANSTKTEKIPPVAETQKDDDWEDVSALSEEGIIQSEQSESKQTMYPTLKTSNSSLSSWMPNMFLTKFQPIRRTKSSESFKYAASPSFFQESDGSLSSVIAKREQSVSMSKSSSIKPDISSDGSVNVTIPVVNESRKLSPSLFVTQGQLVIAKPKVVDPMVVEGQVNRNSKNVEKSPLGLVLMS